MTRFRTMAVGTQDLSEESREAMISSFREFFGNDVPITQTSKGIEFDIDSLGPYPRGRYKSLMQEGDQFKRNDKHKEAIDKYKEAAQLMVGTKTHIPTPYSANGGGGYLCEKYKEMAASSASIDLMETYNEIASSLIKLGRDTEALEWLEEINLIYKNTYLSREDPIFDWFDHNLTSEKWFYQRVKALTLETAVFTKLGNTACAVHRRWSCSTIRASVPSEISQTELKKLIPSESLRTIARLRHPDPTLSMSLEEQNRDLQVLGSWKKIEVKDTSRRIQPRMGSASFVWRSRLYVCGGEKALEGPQYRDLLYLDLKTFDGWKSLPGFPVPEMVSGEIMGWSFGVHDNKAYLFRGSPTLEYFDLIQERWGFVKTTWTGAGTWPFKLHWNLVDFGLVVARGKMYVFGGTYSECAVGCSLFSELDLNTFKWRKLSGNPGPKLVPDFSCPGPRRHPSMWAEDDKRIWLMFGEADRLGARIGGQTHAAENGFGYDDLWSWDIKTEKWRRERISGNPPCPRSEMACTYNPKLEKTIVFGGYSPTLPSHFPENMQFVGFSYYADTFIFDSTPTSSHTAPRWKHVLTRGFPIYRAQAKLISDPDTGKVFLFSGYTNSQFVPQKKHAISRSFGDIWQLRLDLPGGFFQGVDLEEEARTARAGPWQRCFNCGSAGPWKKCGGTCDGKAFFCDPQCLKEGWREHKERHHCGKKA